LSDVVVSVVETSTDVAVTETSVDVNVTETTVSVVSGTSGPQGAVGVGFPTGGTAGQQLVKQSATDYDAAWTTLDLKSAPEVLSVKAGVALTKGQAVYITGATGNNIIIGKAQANTEATSSKTLGLVSTDLANNGQGYVVTQGVLTGLNTASASEGDTVWLSPSVAGGLLYGAANQPVAPNHSVFIGYVTRSHASVGAIYVSVQNGFSLTDLHNVKLTSVANAQVLSYDSGQGLWVNSALPSTVTYSTTSGTAVYATNAGAATTAGTAIYATSSGTSVYGTNSGTAVFATTSGTAVYGINAGTAVFAGQSGTAVYSSTAGTSVYGSTAGTSVYATTAGSATSAGAATTAGTATYATTSGTSVYATTAGTAVYGATSGTAVYATTSGTAVTISGSVTPSQVSGTAVITTDSRLSDARTPTTHASSHASGGSDAVTLAQSQVTNLTTDLAAKAPTASPTFTGTVTTPLTTAGYVTTTSGGVIGSVATIPNAGLTNSSVTVNGSAISLGGSATVTAVAPNVLTLGSGLSGTSFNGSAAVTAAVDSTIPRLTADQTFTGLQTLVTSAAGNKGLIVKGSASQSVNLQEWQDSAGALLASLSGSGRMYAARTAAGASADFTGTANFWSNNSTTIGAIIRGAASQSANLQEWQDSSAAVLVAINSIGGIASANRLTLGQNTTSTVGRFTILENTPTIIPVALRLATGQTADVIQYQSQPGTVLGGRNSNAQIYTGSTAPLTTAVGGATTAASGTGSTATLTTTSNHNLAVGDRITVAGVTPTGYNATAIVTAVTSTTVSYANATTGSQTVAGTVSVDAQASITARSAGTTGMIIKRAASAVANALVVQDSTGATLSYIGPGGDFYGNSVRTINDLARFSELNSGGLITATRTTAAPTAPGTNVGRLYFKTGTTGLALYAMGPTGTEVKIADNIT
jgi:hypothetical protein